MESRLDKIRLCALLVNATPFEGQQMVVALGIVVAERNGRSTMARRSESHFGNNGCSVGCNRDLDTYSAIVAASLV